MKKGQNWSIEGMIAITIFVSVVIISLLMINRIPSNNSKELTSNSEELRIKIENDLGIIEDYEIDEDRLEELRTLSGEELGEQVGLPGSVCISFRTLNGTPIALEDSSIGIGLGNDTICGN